MTLDGFLTFLTLIVASVTLMSPVSKLRLQLGLWAQLCLATLFGFFVLYLLLFESLGLPCVLKNRNYCEYVELSQSANFEPKQLAFLVVIFWMFSAWILSSRLPSNFVRLSRLKLLVEELLLQGSSSELTTILTPYLSWIEKTSKNKRLFQKIHHAVNPNKTIEELIEFLDGKKIEEKSALQKWIDSILVMLRKIGAFFIPSQSIEKQNASEILKILFESRAFADYLALKNPEFAISLLKIDLYGQREFLDLYFTSLIRNKHSTLYKEIRECNADPVFSNGQIDPRHKILFFLFDQPTVAKDLGVYKPIGDFLCRVLKTAEDKELLIKLNLNADYFQDECDLNTVFVGINFFRIMLIAAANKAVEGHMWLYYLQYVSKGICDLTDLSGPDVKETDEFPTTGTRLIFDIVILLCDLVRLSSSLPEGNIHKITDVRQFARNEKIPASAARCLGMLMRDLVLSDNLTQEFKRDQISVVMSCLKDLDLDTESEEGKLRADLIKCLLFPGEQKAELKHLTQMRGFV